MPDLTELEDRFHRAMIGIYENARDDADYVAQIFIEMVDDRGGLRTAQYLLGTDKPSEGFTKLWEKGRLDLTVENLVLKPEYKPLFSAEELSIARQRLINYNFLK